MTRISTPSALLGGFGWFRALTGGHGLVAQNRLLVGTLAGCDCGVQISATNSRWDLAAQGRFKAGTESLAAVGLNGGDRRRRSFNERPLVRLLHPQDRVLAGGRQQVSEEGPVSPSANWHFRPGAGIRTIDPLQSLDSRPQRRHSGCGTRQLRWSQT